jgi:alpha-L-fucosidase 2
VRHQQELQDALHVESTIWNAAPANGWNEGFPLGSGQLGAMLFGGIEEERIALNHEWLWRGMTGQRTTPNVAHRLQDIRDQFFSGNLAAGAALAEEVLGGHGRRIMPYQPVADIRIRPDGHRADAVQAYRRELDLPNAIVTTRYHVGDAAYVQQTIASAADNLVVTRVESTAPVSLQILIERRTIDSNPVASRNKQFDVDDSECSTWDDGNRLGLLGRYPEGITFAVEARVIASGAGAHVTSGEQVGSLVVSEAKSVTIALAMAVRLDDDDDAPSPEDACRGHLDGVRIDWEALRRDHVAEHRPLYDRVTLRVEAPDEVSTMPLATRIARLRGGARDPGLAALYFNYGRFLLLGSSRRCDLPANLQGVWNEHLSPAWQCDFHLNINLQMNYWPAEVCNLPETLESFMRFLDRFRPSAENAARDLYGCRGIYMPHGTDAWGRANPEAPVCDVWQGAAAWLAQHLWWHWEYGGDLAFLRDRAYPYIRDVATFWVDFLVPEGRDGHPLKGKLVSVPSNSPENAYEWNGHRLRYGVGATMDLLLAREVLGNAISASQALGVDAELRGVWRDTINKLAPLQVGSHGQLLEYLDEFPEPEPGHRHVSHLYGVFPGDSITADERPALFKAARISLERRLAAGGGHTGWSRAWTAALWARFGEGDLAGEHLDALLTDFATDSLLDLHPPHIFQIDGNLGGTAAVAEMLMQSHAGMIRVLPALPSWWATGEIQGLRARGGHLVHIVWRDGHVRAVAIEAGTDGEIVVRMPENGPWRVIRDDSPVGSVYSEGNFTISAVQAREIVRVEPA